MRKHPLRRPEDDSDRKLLADVEQFGWHVVGIEADEHGPGYAFSVGLYHTLDQPEILLLGLSHTIAAQLINLIGDAMQAGTTFRDGDIRDEIAEGFPLAFRAVPREYYRDYVGYAGWFYESPDFPLLQCIWPDKRRRFPWDTGCETACAELQRLVNQPDD